MIEFRRVASDATVRIQAARIDVQMLENEVPWVAISATHAEVFVAGEAVPIDMILHCPNCGLQHIDEPSDDAYEGNPPTWTNPPHRSHLCHGCGHIWRPADVPTNGVEYITTKGKNDSPLPWEPPMTEEQGYAIEAAWQFVPELKPREDHLIVLTPAQLETVLRRLGWNAPCDARKGRV